MSTNEKNSAKLARAGTLNQAELREAFTSTTSSDVSISDWGACYSQNTGQLSVYCSAVSNDSGDPITGIGMLAYSTNGSVLYAAQYTNGFESENVYPSIATNQYTPQDGSSLLCIVYGWTENSNFYFSQTITVDDCGY
jgi:hypothetical protein